MEPPSSGEPIKFIERCIEKRNIIWTYHVNMRLKDRFISREAIIESYNNYEIIEEYSDDKYLPSYLVCSKYNDDIFHILFAIDKNGNNVRIITAYSPSAEEWCSDFKTRRGKL